MVHESREYPAACYAGRNTATVIHRPSTMTRRLMIKVMTVSGSLALLPRHPIAAAEAIPDNIAKRFDYLSANGNSNCSPRFMASILAMPDGARLQGSCCGPMSLHRYAEQVEGLKAYAAIPEIPPDPYDIEAGLAKRLLAAYNAELTPAQQVIYDGAFKLSKEGGPCCCQCWRWHVLGGMGKLLIRDRSYDAAKTGALWDLANGCGGDEHVH